MSGTGLRILAFGIAAMAVVDPALRSSRPTRPVVSVVGSGADKVALAARVSGRIARRFTVIRGASNAASATVLVGRSVPDELAMAGGTVFGVLSPERNPRLRIVRMDAPSSVPLNARVSVEPQMLVRGSAGRQLEVDLTVDGMLAGQTSVPVRSDSSTIVVPFPFASDNGARVVRATAHVRGDDATDVASVLLDVRDERLPVLFFDSRPSWNATFVRRAIEQDARFSVTHRVLTSRGLSNTAGNAPVTLTDDESLRDFATVVVGAPDLLSPGDIAGLEAFMRRHGGRVLLLMDGKSTSALDRLTGASGWRGVETSAPATITDSAGRQMLRGRELFWPASISPAAVVHAFSVSRDSLRRPIVWSVPVGAGRLTAAGAMDAWQHRADSSGFDVFWASTIASLSLGAAPPVEVQLSEPILAQGTETTVRAIVRDAFLSDRDAPSARVQAMLVSGRDSTLIRLWPAHAPGTFTGRIVAPRTTGSYRVVVTSGPARADAPLMLDSIERVPDADEPDVMRAFASSRNGAVIDAEDLDRLPDLLASAIRPVSRVETWHPMRSAWWIVPFALLLGVEWWGRRRRGLA